MGRQRALRFTSTRRGFCTKRPQESAKFRIRRCIVKPVRPIVARPIRFSDSVRFSDNANLSAVMPIAQPDRSAKWVCPSSPYSVPEHSGYARQNSHCRPDAGHRLPTLSARLPPWMGLSPNIQPTAPSSRQTPPLASIQADVRPTPHLNKIALYRRILSVSGLRLEKSRRRTERSAWIVSGTAS